MSEKKYVIDNEKLMSEWNWEENKKIGLNPKTLTCGVKTRAFWTCKNGHTWESSINNRNTGYGCPYCSNKKVLAGYNDLLTTHPEIAKEWNYEKNNGLLPTEVTKGSNKKVWWICKNGHEWIAEIACRTGQQQCCPVCAGLKVLEGYNDLATTHPNLCREWNWDKNGNIKPTNVSKGSIKKVWWKCEKGHEWEATINSRTNRNLGCPICSNKKVLIGYNDLLTTNPEICEEWDYEKNDKITQPQLVTKGSDTMVWWKCKKGHSWKAHIYGRTSGRNCPICQKELHTSFPEKAFLYYASLCFEKIVYNYKPDYLEKMEFDIYIPSLKVGIEYDGCVWHKNLSRDIKKNLICEKNKITLLRIREKGCPLDYNKYEYVKYFNLEDFNNDLNKTIVKVLQYLGQPQISVDIERDNIDIMKLLNMSEKTNSVSTNKTLLKEWNYQKNKDIKPEYIKLNSNKKIWWKCSLGHEWQATTYSRAQGNGCPYCSNHKVLIGFNDLTTTHPEIAKEWDYEKNNGLFPTDVTKGSNKKVWWICKNNHSFNASVSKRVIGQGCPICSKQKRVQTAKKKYFENNPSLAVSHAQLCEEWNWEKNVNISPYEVSFGSGITVWWKCSLGHEWQAKISNRVNGNGCPFCAGKKVLKGFNDLQTKFPQVALEWNYKKNKEKADEFVAGSSKKVWWKCSNGHEWIASIKERTIGKTGCPTC